MNIDSRRTNDLSNNTSDELDRVPCRGCLSSCKNYSICQGAPWRLPREEYNPSESHNKGISTEEIEK